MPLTLEVYPTDAEAFEAAAALAAAWLADGGDRRSVALSGGRSGRAVMLALAGRTDVPWERIDWFWGDERCVPPDDPRSNVRVARESLLAPRAIDPGRIHAPALDLVEPDRIAADYAATLTRLLGATPVFDLVFLGVGTNGHIASLMPGCAALRATAPVAAVRVVEVSEEPLVARVTRSEERRVGKGGRSRVAAESVQRKEDG